MIVQQVTDPADLFVDAKILISSHARLLPVLRLAIWNLALDLGWDDSESRSITLAVEEALTNKIRHAYGNRTDGRIQIEFRTDPRALVFRLTDQGEAPDTSRFCLREEDSLTVGGLGTQIIRDVMDEVTYQTVAEGNQVILTKYLPGRKTPEASQ